MYGNLATNTTATFNKRITSYDILDLPVFVTLSFILLIINLIERFPT